MKIAVVGGGSTYTPELIDGFARLADQVTITEIVLIDPDQTKRPPVPEASRRHCAPCPSSFRLPNELARGLSRTHG